MNRVSIPEQWLGCMKRRIKISGDIISPVPAEKEWEVLKRLRLLLDTHIILWSAAEPEKLPSNIAEELISDFNGLWLSPISG